MIRNQPQDNDKAQSGIGILIIFIAIVVVAAIGATVLINTSESFQERGKQTADEAESEVSNKLESLAVYGEAEDVSLNGSTVTRITGLDVSVKKSSGAGRIDISDATIEYQNVAKGNQTRLTYADNASTGEFNLTDTVGVSGTVFTSTDSRGDLSIPTNGDGTSPEYLNKNQEIVLDVITESGAKTQVRFSTPNTINSGTDYKLE